MKAFVAVCLAFAALSVQGQDAHDHSPKVEWQPLAAAVQNVAQALDYLGNPLDAQAKRAIDAAREKQDVQALQQALDGAVLFEVTINPEMRVKVAKGKASAELDEQGWRQFLVKVLNEAGTTAQLKVESPNSARLHNAPADQVPDRWAEFQMFDAQPLQKTLSGLGVEYRILQIYSRDAGKRSAKVGFNVGQGTQDIGFRNESDILFTVRPSSRVILRVLDENDEPTIASFLVRDKAGRVYPSQAKRLAPDFSFHPQVYRKDGEHFKLPQGIYTFEFSRGPESLVTQHTVEVKAGLQTNSFKVQRWIDPSKMGWWSGDHHIHAAGCAHYTKPTEGVHAEDMIRHCIGEDLKIGANLTWGPCFDYQKQFFCGKDDPVSKHPYLLRYDIEVSGFGSHQSGHLCLLQLKEQMYPGGDSMHHWPTLGLNTLRWAKKQGALTGPAHSGWGLEANTTELPNYIIPPYDGIGANEYIMNVTHDVPGPDGKLVPAVDFISTVDTPYVWELNIWYHTLNAGYRTRISGETDFPCIYGEKVGLGRSYVHLDNKLDYESWCEGIREGRNYVSDGKSHFLEFKANGLAMGTKGSELKLTSPGKVKVSTKVASLLGEKPSDLRKRPYQQKPYWDVERARIGESRKVSVEILVNGEPVANREIEADGTIRDLEFEVPINRSSWVAARILPSAHTNPIFVLVNDKPIREKRSIEWCLQSVDQCWSQKQRFYKGAEKDQAKLDYDHARAAYRQRLTEAAE